MSTNIADLSTTLRGIEGYLASKAEHGDSLAANLHQQLLKAFPGASPDIDPADALKIELPLNVFDAEGVVCDTTTAHMTLEQCADIVDHAAQAILLRRDAKETQSVLDNLDEALTTAGVLAEEDPG